MIIGITGKSGSGKSTIGKFFENLSYSYYSIDEIGHFVINEIKDELEKEFGTSDRKQIGDIIFNHRHKYKELTDKIWKRQMYWIDHELKACSYDHVILDFILLPHTKYWDLCDLRILCKCPLDVRKQRVLQRDGITEEYFNLRESASIEYNDKEMDLIIGYE